MSDELSIEELADGVALWQEHKPTSREHWLRIAQRWHAKGLEPPENPSPMFGALYDAWAEVQRLRKQLADIDEQNIMQQDYLRQIADAAAIEYARGLALEAIERSR